jgi:hypothetical protein
MCEIKVQFNSSACKGKLYPVFPVPFIEEMVFFPLCAVSTCIKKKNQSTVNTWFYFWGFYPVPLTICLFILFLLSYHCCTEHTLWHLQKCLIHPSVILLYLLFCVCIMLFKLYSFYSIFYKKCDCIKLKSCAWQRNN